MVEPADSEAASTLGMYVIALDVSLDFLSSQSGFN